MKVLRVLFALGLWLLLTAQSPTPTPPSPSPTPSTVPTPTNANIFLDLAAGGPGTRITVSGSSFLPNEPMNLYWDVASHVAATLSANGNGNFTKVVTPHANDKPGLHRLCASVQPNPCANFTLQGRPSPTPPSSPIAHQSPSSSPTTSARPTSSPAPIAGSSGFEIITRPPFVFFPIIAILGVLGAITYAILSRVQWTQPSLPTASIVHRSARPDIGPVPPASEPLEAPAPDAPAETPPEPEA